MQLLSFCLFHDGPVGMQIRAHRTRRLRRAFDTTVIFKARGFFVEIFRLWKCYKWRAGVLLLKGDHFCPNRVNLMMYQNFIFSSSYGIL